MRECSLILDRLLCSFLIRSAGGFAESGLRMLARSQMWRPDLVASQDILREGPTTAHQKRWDILEAHSKTAQERSQGRPSVLRSRETSAGLVSDHAGSLRQDILLSKWISSGLVMPAVALLFQRYQKDHARVTKVVLFCQNLGAPLAQSSSCVSSLNLVRAHGSLSDIVLAGKGVTSIGVDHLACDVEPLLLHTGPLRRSCRSEHHGTVQFALLSINYGLNTCINYGLNTCNNFNNHEAGQLVCDRCKWAQSPWHQHRIASSGCLPVCTLQFSGPTLRDTATAS